MLSISVYLFWRITPTALALSRINQQHNVIDVMEIFFVYVPLTKQAFAFAVRSLFSIILAMAALALSLSNILLIV